MRRAESFVLVASLLTSIPAVAAGQHHEEKPPVRAEVPPVRTVEANGTVAHAVAPSRPEHAPATNPSSSSSCTALSPIASGRPVVPATAGPGFASFVDPSVRVE
ncbi:MAG: hypothetical protein ABI910_18590, partial [Gemmatimonadota bacterium]